MPEYLYGYFLNTRYNFRGSCLISVTVFALIVVDKVLHQELIGSFGKHHQREFTTPSCIGSNLDVEMIQVFLFCLDEG